MPEKILLVAPYPELAQVASQVRREMGIECKIVVADMAEGVELAREAVNRGVEVVISRGGTALLIRDYVAVPVVDIPVTGFDISEALAPLRGYNAAIGVIGFKNVIKGCQKIAQSLEIPLYEMELKAKEDITACLDQAIRVGVRAIVGDGTTTKMAIAAGLEARLIDSGPDSFRSAFTEALRLIEVKQRERERSEQVKAIIDHINDGVIAVDEWGNVSLFNPAAERILGLSSVNIIGGSLKKVAGLKPLTAVTEGSFGELSRVVPIGNKRVVVKRVPLVAAGEVRGFVLTVHDAGQIQSMEKQIRRELNSKGFTANFTLDQMVSEAKPMLAVIEDARRFAQVDSTVLICGETGTGKELMAQGIHNASPRKDGPFVAVNCAAIAESLLESELFGYAPGAFTSARREGKMGYFEMAHGGTIFLDEIGEAPLGVQAKLLRVLQEHQVMRLGDEKVIPVDVRVIAATNKDLLKLVSKGQYREDLYYRLCVISIKMPALRERPEDIGPLSEFFIASSNVRFGKQVKGISAEARQILQAYNWPGNVRELEHVIQRIVLTAEKGIAEVEHLGDFVRGKIVPLNLGTAEGRVKLEVKGTLAEMEQAIVQEVLRQENNNLSRTAKRLGVNRTTLWRWINNAGR